MMRCELSFWISHSLVYIHPPTHPQCGQSSSTCQLLWSVHRVVSLCGQSMEVSAYLPVTRSSLTPKFRSESTGKWVGPPYPSVYFSSLFLSPYFFHFVIHPCHPWKIKQQAQRNWQEALECTYDVTTKRMSFFKL